MRDTEPVEDNRAANLACKRKGGSAAPISAIAAAPAGGGIARDFRSLRPQGRRRRMARLRDRFYAPKSGFFGLPARVRICALPDREESEAGAKERRLFGGHGDRPRFATRPRSSPRYCRARHATEAGFGGNRRRCLLCPKPLQLRRSSTSSAMRGRNNSGEVDRDLLDAEGRLVRLLYSMAATLCANVAKRSRRFRAWDAPRAEERPPVLADVSGPGLLAKIAAKPEVASHGRWRSESQVGVSGILCKQPLRSLAVVSRGQRADAG